MNLQPIAIAHPPVPGATGWRVHVYAHTHWDREWYRTFERFRMQLVGMVDRLLDTLDSDERFATFVLDGQTIVLEDYLAIRPEEAPRISRLVGAGRLEIGPWHVLPDEFLVSAESLVRNLLEGRRVATRFGTPLAVGYLPDPFGHVAQLPAILRGFGIDNVIFSRGMGDEHVRTGNEFRWESPSGVDVLALVQGSPYTSGYCNAEHLGRGNGADDPVGYEHVRELVPHLARHGRSDVLLLAAGCDHETVQEQLPDIVERIGELLPGCDVSITGLDAYVADVRSAEQALERDGAALERLRGELRGSLHAPILASIFSARIRLKQDNDELQQLLERHVEPLMAVAVASGVRPLRDVQPFLRQAWRHVLENHPHDSIGGCSIDAVHEEMHARTLRARAICGGLIEDLRIALGLSDVAVVHDAWGAGGMVRRCDGTFAAIRPATPGVLVDADPLVSSSGAQIDGPTSIRSDAGVCARVIELDGEPTLQIGTGDDWTSLMLVDEADAGDEYDFGALAGDEHRSARLVTAEASMAGPGVAQLDVRYQLDLPASLTEDRRARSSMTIEHEVRVRARVALTSPLVHLDVELDNRARDHRLRLRAGVAGLAPSDTVQALGHFAIVERPARHPQTEQPWRQVPTQLDHCAGAVRAGEVLVAGRGIHEYEADAGRLELTLLRSVGWLSRDDVAGRPGHAGPALETPGAQCLGPHRIELAVGVGERATFEAAQVFLAPPILIEPFGAGQHQAPGSGLDGVVVMESGALARARDVFAVTPADARARIAQLGLELDGDGVMASTCKVADDGSGDLVVRWWAPAAGVDSAGRRPRVRVRSRAGLREVHRARLDETRLGPVQLVDGACDVGVAAGEIVTLRLVFDSE